MISWLFVKSFFISFGRGIHSFYKATKINIGSSSSISWPLRIEGNGKISIGGNSVIERECEFILAENSIVEFGDYCTLQNSVRIQTGSKGVLKCNNNIVIQANSRLIINSFWSFSDSARIASGCQIFSREFGYAGKLIIGEGTNIGDDTILDVSDDIEIGSNVAVGPRCIFYTHDHDYRENPEIPWKGKVRTKSIAVGEGAWIGAGVTILPGVKIGRCAIIAAGAVVTKDIAPYSLNGGVPSKAIVKSN